MPIIKMRWWRMCAPRSLTATRPGSDSCQRSAGLPAAAGRPLVHRVERRAPRRPRLRALDARRVRRCARGRRAARRLGGIELTTPVASFPLKLQVRGGYVRPRAVLLGRCRARGASAGRAGIESGAAGLRRLSPKCSRRARDDAELSASPGCCDVMSAGAGARICSPPPLSMAGAAVLELRIR